AGFVLAKIPEARAGRVHPDRLIVAIGDAWFAVGPALVFAIAHESSPAWDDGALYLLAVFAQFGFDAAMAMLRVWAGIGIPPRLQLDALARVYVVDLLLT